MNKINKITLAFLLTPILFFFSWNETAHARKHKKGHKSTHEFRLRTETVNRSDNDSTAKLTSIRYLSEYAGRYKNKFHFDGGFNFTFYGGETMDPLNSNQNVFESQAGGLLNVHKASVLWNLSKRFSLSLGRMPIEFGEGSLMNSNHYYDTPHAFDGLSLSYQSKKFTLTLYDVYIKYVNRPSEELNNTIDVDNRTGMFIASYDQKKLPKRIKHFNAHLLWFIKDDIGRQEKENRKHVGASLAGTFGKVWDYRGFYGRQYGEIEEGSNKTDIEAYMFDLEAGFTLPKKSNTRIYAGYHLESGDKGVDREKNYQPFYYDRHHRAGLMDRVRWGANEMLESNGSSIERNGLSAISVGATTTALKQTSFGVHYHQFKLDDEAFAKEIDVTAERNYYKKLSLLARIGYFMPEASNEDNDVEVSVQFKWKF